MKSASAKLYKQLKNQKVRCLACQRQCLITPDQTGFCLTRQNHHGKLRSLTYGAITGIQIDPIEKKPLYHFYPGAKVASIGSYGCNFHCKQCLNHPHSWGELATQILKSQLAGIKPVSPEKIIREVKKTKAPGIAFTYNEPVINPEFIRDTARLAKKEGLFTVMVTNGSWTRQALDYYGQYIDAANIDFKGFSSTTYQKMGAYFGQIPALAQYAQKKHKIHLEVTTLLIPTINIKPRELKKMASWMVKNLGPKTPWHLSRFSPDLAPDQKFARLPPTSINQLQQAAQIGRQAGLQFVYIWAPTAGCQKW